MGLAIRVLGILILASLSSACSRSKVDDESSKLRDLVREVKDQLKDELEDIRLSVCQLVDRVPAEVITC